MGYVLTRRARLDIREIGRFTQERWGLAQAEVYLRAIENALDMIAQHPAIGRSRDEVREGYRSFPTGSHIVFYRPRGRDVEIVRVLHGRMDLDRQL